MGSATEKNTKSLLVAMVWRNIEDLASTKPFSKLLLLAFGKAA